jgi:hypothetical protein
MKMKKRGSRTISTDAKTMTPTKKTAIRRRWAGRGSGARP